MQLLVELSSKSEDCNFFLDKPNHRFIKLCKDTDAFSIYKEAFQKELHDLQDLNERCTCLPAYYASGVYTANHYYGSTPSEIIPKGTPFISMEYIEGVSLEAYLEKCNCIGNQPACLLSPRQLSHICQQVFDTICFLYLERGVVYLDIWPRNIIITNNDTFDIKLIDFTFCYANDNGVTRKNEHRLHTQKRPIAAMLARAMMFFVIRLFYRTEKDYDDSFSPKTLHLFENICNGHLDQLFNDVFESPSNDWLIHDACCSPRNNPERHLELINTFHTNLQNRLKRLFE